MLSNTIVGGGNLVKPTEFFREGNCYFKSYRFIPGESSLAIADSAVTRRHRLVFLRTFLLCLRELHTHGIVHGDLKPENVLIERRGAGPVARLIDFDEAYLTGRPPPPSQTPGSEDYYSPELVRYRNNDVGARGPHGERRHVRPRPRHPRRADGTAADATRRLGRDARRGRRDRRHARVRPPRSRHAGVRGDGPRHLGAAPADGRPWRTCSGPSAWTSTVPPGLAAAAATTTTGTPPSPPPPPTTTRTTPPSRVITRMGSKKRSR